MSGDYFVLGRVGETSVVELKPEGTPAELVSGTPTYRAQLDRDMYVTRLFALAPHGAGVFIARSRGQELQVKWDSVLGWEKRGPELGGGYVLRFIQPLNLRKGATVEVKPR